MVYNTLENTPILYILMNEYLYFLPKSPDIINVYWIIITYLIYFLQVTTNFHLHFHFLHLYT